MFDFVYFLRFFWFFPRFYFFPNKIGQFQKIWHRSIREYFFLRLLILCSHKNSGYFRLLFLIVTFPPAAVSRATQNQYITKTNFLIDLCQIFLWNSSIAIFRQGVHQKIGKKFLRKKRKIEWKIVNNESYNKIVFTQNCEWIISGCHQTFSPETKWKWKRSSVAISILMSLFWTVWFSLFIFHLWLLFSFLLFPKLNWPVSKD